MVRKGVEVFVPEDLEPPAAPRERTALGAIRVGARALVGIVGIGVACAAIAAATWLPLPRHAVTPTSLVVTPVAATQQRVCPGPLLRIGDQSGQNATIVSSLGQPDIQASSTSGAIEQSPLHATENHAGVAPHLLTLPVQTGTTSARYLDGSQSQAVAAGDIGGFAAAECAEPSSDTWLVGGATETGRTTLITLSNPGQVSAVVSISVATEAGTLVVPGSDGIVVPPSTQRILSLAGFAPGARSTIVRVQARGGQVLASLQQSIVRTLVPGGVAIVGASTAPSTDTVIPGVVLANSATVAAQQVGVGAEDLAPVLRVYVPGTAAAKAQIRIVPENGSAVQGPIPFDLPGGVVTDIPLDVGDDGSYTIDLATDLPAVASVRTSTIGAGGGVDVEWFAAATVLHHAAEVAVAPGPSPTLHLANAGQKDAVVTISSAGKQDQNVAVPSGRAVAVPVAAGTGYAVTGFDALRMSVSYLGDGRLGAFAVSPAAPAASPIRVY